MNPKIQMLKPLKDNNKKMKNGYPQKIIHDYAIIDLDDP